MVNLWLVGILLLLPAMNTLCCALVRDGDELLVAVPENRTVEFYKYLRGFGFCFTLHSRSEERRVGKECRSRWWPYRLKKKKKKDNVKHGCRAEKSKTTCVKGVKERI